MAIAIRIPELPPFAQQLADYARAKPLHKYGYREDGAVRMRPPGQKAPNKGTGIRGSLIRLMRSGPATRAQMREALPEVSIKAIDCALKVAVQVGEAERYGRAHYRIHPQFSRERRA